MCTAYWLKRLRQRSIHCYPLLLEADGRACVRCVCIRKTQREGSVECSAQLLLQYKNKVT